jgi:hypothetical protein
MPLPARVQVARPPGMIDRHPGGRVSDRRQLPAIWCAYLDQQEPALTLVKQTFDVLMLNVCACQI